MSVWDAKDWRRTVLGEGGAKFLFEMRYVGGT